MRLNLSFGRRATVIAIWALAHLMLLLIAPDYYIGTARDATGWYLALGFLFPVLIWLLWRVATALGVVVLLFYLVLCPIRLHQIATGSGSTGITGLADMTAAQVEAKADTVFTGRLEGHWVKNKHFSNIKLGHGDLVAIRAEGGVCPDRKGSGPYVGPNGGDQPKFFPRPHQFKCPDFGFCGLIAALVDEDTEKVFKHFPVGTDYVIEVKRRGAHHLAFALNERWTSEACWNDNEGGFDLTISVLHPE